MTATASRSNVQGIEARRLRAGDRVFHKRAWRTVDKVTVDQRAGVWWPVVAHFAEPAERVL